MLRLSFYTHDFFFAVGVGIAGGGGGGGGSGHAPAHTRGNSTERRCSLQTGQM